MLEIVNYNVDEYGFPCLVVLGCFDGLHVGHAELLKKAKLQAKINGLDLGVMMFVDGKGGKQVYTFDERLKLLEKFNVKFVLKIDYTAEFKKTLPIDFLLNIEEKINVKAYMSGKDFRFGAGAKGKSSTLKNYAEDEENGVWYMSVKDVVWNEKKVSTTLVKEFIENGDIKSANELLGRRFSVTGTVIEGADRGKKLLGFPTMNVEYPENKIELKRGVYAVKVNLGETQYNGIANFGSRPTFDEEKELIEVYLDGYDGSAYGETINIEFAEFIRDIQKFDSPEALSAQLGKDLVTANGLFAAEEGHKETPVAPTAVEKATKPVTQPNIEEVIEQPAEQTPEQKPEPVAEEVSGQVVEEAEKVVEEPAPVEEIAATDIEESIDSLAESVVENVTDEEPEEVVPQMDEFEEVLSEEVSEETIEQIDDSAVNITETPSEELPVSEVLVEMPERQEEEPTEEQSEKQTVEQEEQQEEISKDGCEESTSD